MDGAAPSLLSLLEVTFGALPQTPPRVVTALRTHILRCPILGHLRERDSQGALCPLGGVSGAKPLTNIEIYSPSRKAAAFQRSASLNAGMVVFLSITTLSTPMPAAQSTNCSTERS